MTGAGLPSSDATRRLRAEAVWRDVDDEVIALDDRLTTYVSTHGSGALLWRALHDGATPAELTERLVAEYGIERERAQHDVAVFLGDLDRMGFLEP
jgi:hypothetical protein